MADTEALVNQLNECAEKQDFDGAFRLVRETQAELGRKIRADGVREALKKTTNDRLLLSFVDGVPFGAEPLDKSLVRLEKLLGFQPGALVLNQLPYAGFATTYSANADVTDSAASATAFACGRKTNNSMLGMLPDRTHVKSVATCAHEAGFAVGLVTDDPFVGATPSAYYAHVPVRSYSEDIVRDASKCGFEILLGYHCKRYFLPKAKGGKRRDGRDILSEMTGNGYALCETFASFLEAPRDKRVLGQLKDGELDDESRYGQLTQTALDRLSQGGKRFFVLIESGDPDHGSHANKPNDTVGGVVKIDGKTVFNGTVKASPSQRELLPLRRDMQMIFQDPFASLDPRMTVGAIVTEGIKKHGIAKGKQAIELAAHTLELCGLDADNLRRYPHEFSGGQRQRIGIARALVLRPKFIIADEPIAALDVSIQAQVLNLLVDLQDQLGLTYLFISHDLGVVRHFCNRIGVMYLGNLVEMGDIETVYERPLHPYTEVLLSAIPSSESDSKARHIHLLGEPPSPVDPPTGCPFHPRCPYATEQCKREKPVLQQKDGRMVACWKYA